ncbi:MAG: MMPL family transporter [Verrucomicrobiota bacterium]|nr:MMPL family transporter [Verrucomicrobiota bacterium]
MQASEKIAHVLTQRRRLVWLVLALAAAASLFVLITRLRLDTEILNLLPRGFPAVEGLKVYNNEFAQTRELTFALLCDPQDVDALEEFAPTFVDRLREQPWTLRVLAGSPMATPDGVSDLQGIALPLLLNLEPEEFDRTISILQPARIRDRLAFMRDQIQSGSPRPQLEVTLDPLGVIAPSLKPFAGSAALEGDQPLTSPDRTMRVFPLVTRQKDTSAFACQALMKEINAWRVHAADGWNGKAPLQVLITGRSAYVAELSLSMRYDIVVTLVGSMLLVSIVFYLGFRRIAPLLGMGFSLLLCCLFALAAGLLVFGRLNMVTVGFCAILVGLGVDFAILIYGRYQQQRNEGLEHEPAIADALNNLGRAIFFGALTTAVGFLALTLSNSTGFIQLGVLIAIGISVAAVLMTTVFFLLMPRRHKPRHGDLIFAAVQGYVMCMLRRPRLILACSLPPLIALSVIAVLPQIPLTLVANARSMEPKHSRAGDALTAIMEKMPVRWEPVLGIIRATNAQQLHDEWKTVAAHWKDLQQRGVIKSFTTPAALAFSPREIERNRAQLAKLDLGASRTALQNAITSNGFSGEVFAPAFKLLDQLQAAAQPDFKLPDWRTQLPESSAWWFLIDRYFGHDPLLTAGFATTNAPLTTQPHKDELARELPVAGIPMTLSGWSYTLTDLVPWSRHQLIVISALMALFDASLLAVLYRNLRLWFIQIVTLAFAVAAMIATMKLVQLPLNLLNVLAFRLVLAIGVDYGIYVLLVWQRSRDIPRDLSGVLKPVLLAGLTAIAGFGSLGWAHNPTLAGLGIACAIGLFWSLAATIFFTLPAAAATQAPLLHD